MPYADPEVRRKFMRNYYLKNEAVLSARSKAHHEAHRDEHLLAAKARWARLPPEERSKQAKRTAKYYAAHPERARNSRLKNKFGITLSEYETLLAAQGGGCAICGGRNRDKKTPCGLCVDHDHSTGAIRGLLCGHCNKALGGFRDDPELLKKAIAYLAVCLIAPPR